MAEPVFGPKPGEASPVRIGRRDARLLPLTVAAIGLLSILLLAVTHRWQRRISEQEIAALRAVGELQATAAIIHLWMEEFVSGDAIDLQEIDRMFARCAELVGALRGQPMAGEKTASSLARLLEPALAAEAETLARELAEFQQLSSDRVLGYRRGLQVGIGSAFDVEYDRVFRLLLQDSRRLEEALFQQRRRNARQDSQLFAGLLAGWAALLGLASFGLWSRERRRLAAELALGQSEARLQRAQKLDAVGRLSGGLAHDINNYLAAIRSQSELLAGKRSDDALVAGKMALVLGTVDKASTLIERLLAFSRRQPARREAVDWNQQIESLLPVLAASCGPRVELERDLEAALWPVLGDPAQLEQILLNLVVNAADAVEAVDDPRISLRTRNLAGGGEGLPDRVLLTVADNGVGIAPELVDHIFEPFFTTKGRDGRHGAGAGEHSGLGLASVYGIVEQSGGHLDVHSKVGEGATFEVVLPRAAPAG